MTITTDKEQKIEQEEKKKQKMFLTFLLLFERSLKKRI